jgi:4'-phosphopantetheinyl transferase
MNISDSSFCRISLDNLRGDAPFRFIQQKGSQTPVLQPDDIHLWLTNVDRGNWPLDELQRVLSDEERTRSTKFHFEADRKRYIVRHATLRQLTGQYLEKAPSEIEFNLNSFGKPELASANAALQFNLSTSAEWVMLAFARHRKTGVDIEKIRQDLDWREIASHFFHTREMECIGGLPEAERLDTFFTYWTMKEAFIKARGVGLQRSLLEIDFTPVVRAGQKSYVDADRSKWLCVSFRPGEQLVAGLVVAA